MTSRDAIPPAAAQEVAEMLAEHLAYVARLRERMREIRIEHDDPVMVAVEKAWASLSAARMAFHYLGMPGTGG